MTNVSVAMATFNGGTFLQAQLDSFIAQNRQPDELVVCDDGSSDGTVELLTEFARTAPFLVRIERNAERLGYNANFAKAIGLCTGNLIFISDQDDIWYPDKIERVIETFGGTPRALAVTNDQMITDGDGRASGVTVLQNVRRLGSPDALFGPGCCTALRREALPLLTPFPSGVVPYDHWVTTLPELLGARALLEAPLQIYRRHDSNTSGSVFSDAKSNIFSLAARAHRRDQRQAYDHQVEMIETIEERLVSRQELIGKLGLSDRLAEARAVLAAQRSAYAARSAALGRGRLRRVPAVWAMLRGGSYRQFQGLKSALKDLIS